MIVNKFVFYSSVNFIFRTDGDSNSHEKHTNPISSSENRPFVAGYFVFV